MSVLNFTHYKGDTFDIQEFQINVNSVALDLTDCAIKMQLRSECGGVIALELSDGNGLTITDGPAGEFVIDKQIINIDSGLYEYDIEITFANDDVKTWIRGTFNVICDITR